MSGKTNNILGYMGCPLSQDKRGIIMTDLEMMQRAKNYIDKMANGVNPVTDLPVSDEDCVSNVRISRCLFFVSDVLRKVIENGGIGSKKAEMLPFSITPEQLGNYSISEKPITISAMSARISSLVDTKSMRKFGYRYIYTFLTENGYLKQVEREEGKKSRVPTEKGFEIGIIQEDRLGQAGYRYTVNLLTDKAQLFILDNMDQILELCRNDSQWTSSSPSSTRQEECRPSASLRRA